jgi:hypothetical protein
MKNQKSLINAGQAFAKIHLSASKDPFRQAMNYVQFCTLPAGPQGPGGLYATATDAHTLFWINVSEVLSNPEILPADFYLHADQYKKLTGSKVYLIACDQDQKTIRTMDKAGNTLDVLPYLDPVDMVNGPGKYPQWTAVLPTSTEHQLTGGQIGLSPKLIGRAAQIMEAGPWIVTFREANRAVIVQYANPEDNGTAQGLIMPLMLHNMEHKEKQRQDLNAKLAQAYEKAQDRKHAAEAMPE